MKTFHRYQCTLKQEGCPDAILSTVAGSVAKARAKANYQWSNMVPFVSWKPSNIHVRKLELVIPGCVLM